MTLISFLLLTAGLRAAAEIPQYQVYELVFEGSALSPEDSPVRDVTLETTWKHELGEVSYQLFGFWDGDGKGGSQGNIFKVRFCPTLPGEWKLVSVISNDPKLNGQHAGMSILCIASGHPGFWERDPASAGGRWYRRSDGSHPYILGNTMYSYLSEYYLDKPNGSDIESDTRNCSAFYNKLRFAMTGDIYPHPSEKPFLDESGVQTDDGNYSHRPNPAWFYKRVDLSVQTACEGDMIADMIINSVDSEQGRSVLKAGANGGDAGPILRYLAARYGSYPNVWFCLTNEYNIRNPRFTASEIRDLGTRLRNLLEYPTPLSVHPNQQDWDPGLHDGTGWNDHVIFQNKIKYIWLAADKINLNYYKGAGKPVINDELAYEGEGDGWLEEDVLEAFLGVFLGGGYGSTGYKTGHKLGQYFAGRFDATGHSASDNLLWFRQQIDRETNFWKMQPATIFYTRKEDITLDIFRNVDYDFRLLKENGKTYVLGAAGPRKNIIAKLPEGKWDVVMFDLVTKSTRELGTEVSGEFTFDFPESRALFVILKKSNI
ncbi:MAG: hypothetical protein AMS26_17130 [Bacteroides sp. SM23_62]|nr:MAG: hypothetical protein AMS26_17130 [Bacteroides sp. SM23_62]